MQRQVGDHELFIFNSDPYYGDLRTAIGIERRQMSEWRLCDQFTNGLWNLHGWFSFPNISMDLRLQTGIR